jgi:hypothetical protein
VSKSPTPLVEILDEPFQKGYALINEVTKIITVSECIDEDPRELAARILNYISAYEQTYAKPVYEHKDLRV